MRLSPGRLLPGLAVALLATSCAGNASSSSSSSSSAATSSVTSVAVSPSSELTVPAVRSSLTTNSRSPVVHDTETNAIVVHSGRLFAATDQWEYPGPSAAGQVLVKSSPTSPWAVFEQTQSLRVDALDSFPIPADQGLGSGHSLLVTQAIVNGRSEIQWLLDGSTSFAPSDSYALPSTGADIRAFGAHESAGVWAVYAGVRPTGILRGTWSSQRHTLIWGPTPELTLATPRSAGLVTQKVTGFAECAGALYVSVNTKLFRRNDGTLQPGTARWVVVYQAPPVGVHNSGLRGLTCVTHDRSPALLLSTEGNGNVYRLDHLPAGALAASPAPSAGQHPGGVALTLELAPVPAIEKMLAEQGAAVPARGAGSIAYVIAAYNDGDFQAVKIDGADRQVFGFEWSYLGACPAARTCEPSKPVSFDAAACFAIRTDRGSSPTYTLRCLGGPQLTPAALITTPVRSGQAFVSIRTIVPSPFGDGRLYYGGYDCNFTPADGTAWVATSTLTDLRVDDPKETNP